MVITEIDKELNSLQADHREEDIFEENKVLR